MTNYQFLQKYIELQKGIVFDKTFDLEFATICFSENDPSPFWNNALVNSVLSATEIGEVETQLSDLQREPAFYFENRENLAPLSVTLEDRGYQKEAEDSLMFHDGEGIDESRFENVKKVTNEEELDAYIATLDKSYQKDDPQNPYGELGDYLKSARIAWQKNHINNKVEYFIVYKDTEPVAVATLANHDGVGYISNVGSLRTVRGEGFGKLATLYCVVQSKKNGNIMHSIATEEGTNPNSFYKAIGFKTRFTAKLMVKKEVNKI